MKKLILALAAIISTFALSNSAFATSPVNDNLSKYYGETLKETFAIEGIEYDFSTSNYSDERDDVPTIYAFRKEGCNICRSFYSYFIRTKLLPNYGDKFRIVSYEVSKNTDNYFLLSQIADTLGQPITSSYATPAVVIGDTISFGNLSSNREDEIINLIENGTTDIVNDTSNPRVLPTTSFTDATTGITLNTTDKYYTTHTLSATATDASNLTLDGYEYISAHNINLMNGAITVPLANTSLTLSIPVTKTYKTYKVAYIENGQIAKVIDAVYQNGLVTFNTSHLSEYAIYGSNTETLTPTEVTETSATTTVKKAAPTAPNGGVQSANAISTNVTTLILLLGISGVVFTYRQNRAKRS